MSKASETPTLIAFLRRLRPGTGLTWADLDAYLDGSEQSFAKDCRRLWRGLDRKGIRILPLSPGDERDERCYDGYYHSQSSLRSDGMQAYERELGRLPRLSRIGEFRFARRYSFYRSWLDEVLGDCGFDEPRVKEILLKEDLDKIEWPAKATRKPERIEHAKQRLTELTELRNVYLHGVLYIVMSAVHKYRGRGIETPDLIQEGNVSLYQAFEGFDWRRDVRFKTYAEYWVNQAFLKILYNSVRTVRVPVWVQKALKKIKDLQARVAIAEGRELSNAEIGKELDLPEDKVKDLIATQRYAVSIDAEIGGGEEAGRGREIARRAGRGSRSYPARSRLPE